MKVSGILILVVGIAAALFTVINTMAASKPVETPSVGTAAANPSPAVPPVVIPLVVAAAGIGVGTGLLIYGGKGYHRIQNPAVRN